jgi:hypothetical protein
VVFEGKTLRIVCTRDIDSVEFGFIWTAGTKQRQAADKGESKRQARHWTALGVNIHK